MIHENESQVADLSDVKVVSRQASIRSIQPKKMSILDNVFLCALMCVFGGVAASSQGVINSKLGQYTTKGFSSTIVFCVGALASCVYFLIEVRGRPPTNLGAMVAKAPWWSWTGGVLGACYVIVTILSIPSLGSGTTSAIVISSKLVFSCIIDHFQLFGLQRKRRYSLLRLIASLGLVASVAVIAKF